MSSKTLGNAITWSFVALSAVCLLGALLLLCVQPTAENMLLVSTASLGLTTTTFLASWK
jgi:hypothetical protein